MPPGGPQPGPWGHSGQYPIPAGQPWQGGWPAGPPGHPSTVPPGRPPPGTPPGPGGGPRRRPVRVLVAAVALIAAAVVNLAMMAVLIVNMGITNESGAVDRLQSGQCVILAAAPAVWSAVLAVKLLRGRGWARTGTVLTSSIMLGLSACCGGGSVAALAHAIHVEPPLVPMLAVVAGPASLVAYLLALVMVSGLPAREYLRR